MAESHDGAFAASTGGQADVCLCRDGRWLRPMTIPQLVIRHDDNGRRQRRLIIIVRFQCVDVVGLIVYIKNGGSIYFIEPMVQALSGLAAPRGPTG